MIRLEKFDLLGRVVLIHDRGVVYQLKVLGLDESGFSGYDDERMNRHIPDARVSSWSQENGRTVIRLQ